MEMKKEKLNDINVVELNNVLSLSSRILKILYIVIIVGIVFIGTMVLKEWQVFNFLYRILIVISPFFIGLVIAWLFNPVVTYISEKGKTNRTVGTIIVYTVFVAIIIIIMISFVPILFDQINDLANAIPVIIRDANIWLNELLDKIGKIDGIDIFKIRGDFFASLESYGKDIAVGIPQTFVKVVTGLFSGLGKFILGLLLGFYLLINFGSTNEQLFSLIPKKYRKEAHSLVGAIDIQLRRFIKGTVLSACILVLFNMVGFAIVGLKAPILFAIFCGITNVIPYIGPYVGGIPALIVGFSQDPATGLFVLAVIVISQTIEGNIINPIIMSKAMKLRPVTIIVSLLIFGYLFGMWGMILATPAMAVFKIIGKFILKKFKLFDMEDYDLEIEFEELKNKNY